MAQASSNPASLVTQYLPLIRQQIADNKVLDLACGSGRNGLFLSENNIPVVFADNNPGSLTKVASASAFDATTAELWLVDFEVPGAKPLSAKKFDVVMVFNYLHRPLINEIKDSLVEGGLLLYETFTLAQAGIGRPRNPDFLLKPGELVRWFEGWEVLHQFEGAGDEPTRFYANIVVRKPRIQ